MSPRPPHESGKKKRRRGSRRSTEFKSSSSRSTTAERRGFIPPERSADTLNANVELEAEALGARTRRISASSEKRERGASGEQLLSAGLFAAASVFSWFNVANELQFHILSDRACAAWAGSAFLCGLILGLLIPRRIIQRRLERPIQKVGIDRVAGRRTSASNATSLEFAASMTGGLMLIFGLLLVTLTLMIRGLEGYRAFLVQRFTFSPGITLGLLCIPILVLVGLSGFWTGIVLSALHGWRRLARQPDPRLSQLWVALLLGGLIAALVTPLIAAESSWIVSGPVAAFAASIAAVWRRRSAPFTPPPASDWTAPTRSEIVDLLIVAQAAFIFGAAWMITPIECALREQTTTWTALLLGGLAGIVALKGIRNVQQYASLAAYFLLFGAIFLLIPLPYSIIGLGDGIVLRLFLVAGGACGAIASVAHVWGQSSHRIQRTVSWLGVVVASSLVLSHVLGLWTSSIHARSLWATLISLLGTCGAGYFLLTRQTPYKLPRMVALVTAGVWLFFLLPARNHTVEAQSTSRTTTATTIQTHFRDEARRLVSAEDFLAEYVPALPPTEASTAAWNIDLNGTAPDLIVFLAADADAEGMTKRAGRRLTERAARHLAPGGRLLIELPASSGLRRGLMQWLRHNQDKSRTGYELTLSDETGTFTALAIGVDIPALIERNRRFCAMEIELRPLIDESVQASEGQTR